ncbi:unnamed protein product [Meganyctiphanes norvegica]|uniref:LITAF domain-containing protein n=1 Tax=Meganyctiphanes norvegica TaxID=48144 RepID=A0AAV2QU72_MEGNR
MSSGSSPARSCSRRSGRAGVKPQSSVSSSQALIPDDTDDEDSFTEDSEAESTAASDISSSSNTTFSEDHSAHTESKESKGAKARKKLGLILKFPEYLASSGNSASNSELEDIYESESDDETPVVEYDWDKLFAQGKKGTDESKLIRYVLPGDEDKLEDRLEDVEPAWPDYQQDILTPINSPTEPITQCFSDATAAEANASLLDNTDAVDSTTSTDTPIESSITKTSMDSIPTSTAVTNMPSNEGSSANPTPSSTEDKRTVSSNMASSTVEDTHSTTLCSKTDSNYGSMQTRTHEILSQRSNQAAITSQPSRGSNQSMGTQDDWDRLFTQELPAQHPAAGSDLPPPYSPPRSDSLVAGMNCPSSGPAKASSLDPGGDPLLSEPMTPPQPRMAILARQPSFDHGPRRSLLRDPRSKRFFCQVCMKQIDSCVRSRPKTIAWVTGWLLCLIGCMGIARCDYGCCLLPCCFDPCLVITHSCPYCEAEIVEDDERLEP